jgi:hypothetical protein
MYHCVNENCKKDLDLDSPDKVLWGCDGDWACSQKCYGEARKQMDHFCSVTLRDDQLFEDWFLAPQQTEVKRILKGSALFKMPGRREE